MTFFSDPRFITSIFSSSEVSTKGPFLSDLLITLRSGSWRWALGSGPCHGWSLELEARSPLLLPSLNDELVRGLPAAGLVTLGRLAPRRHRVTAARGLAFATA